jgi:hypothetical protein
MRVIAGQDVTEYMQLADEDEEEELAAQNTSQHPGAHGKDVVGGRAPDAAHAGGEGSHASPPLSLASKTAR